MALIPNRFELVRLGRFPETPDLCQGLEAVVIQSAYWDHPSGKPSFLIQQVTTTTNQYGQVISRESSEWFYEGIIQGEGQAPTRFYKSIEALIWLPGVTTRASLIKVEEEFGVYWLGSAWASGPLSRRVVKSGYVVYDLAPTSYNPEAVASFLIAQGRKVPGQLFRKIPDSARPWSSAIQQAAIVEQEGQPQLAVWLEPWEVEEVIVRDDFLRTITFTLKWDYTKPGPPTTRRTEVAKDPSLTGTPVPPEAPRLTTDDTTSGVRLEIRGGDGQLKHVWPNEVTVPVPVTAYALYRKTVVKATSAATGDPYGLWKTNPAPPATRSILETTAAKDYGGSPAPEVPAQTAYSEGESNAAPPVVTWEHLADLDNAEKDKMLSGHAVYKDTDVEVGSSYEYYAIARIAESESPESNHCTVAPALKTKTSGLRVRVFKPKAKAGEGTPGRHVCIDVLDPRDDTIGSDSPLYGEPVVLEIPALLDDMGASIGIEGELPGGPGDPSLPTWPADTLRTAEDLGRAVGLRQMLADQERLQVKITPTVPLLFLDRGQRITIPQVAWETYGNSLHLSSRIVPSAWVVEGWSIGGRRSGDTFEVELGDIIAEEP